MTIPLGEVYTCCGTSSEVNTRTGKHLKPDRDHDTRFEFRRDDVPFESEFICEQMYLRDDVGLKVGDRVTIATFRPYGPTFLVFNHTNGEYHYYSEALEDLGHALAHEVGFFSQWSLSRRLRKDVRNFDKSRMFSTILGKIRCL